MRPRWTVALGMTLVGLSVAGATLWVPASPVHARPLQIDVWTTGGDDAVVCAGEPVDVYFQTTKRATVIIYAVDSDGWVRLLYPSRRWQDHAVTGFQTHRIRTRSLSSGPKGLVLIGAVAARESFPVAHWFDSGETYVFVGEESWVFAEEVAERGVIGRVAGDPFEAVWAIEDALVPERCRDRGFATDLAWYSIGSRGPRPWYVWAGDPWCDWDCGLHVSLGIGAVLDWPLRIVRSSTRPHCRVHVHPRPGYEVRTPPIDRKWKGDPGGIRVEKVNKRGKSDVIQSERSKSPVSGSGANPKNTPEAKPSGGQKRYKKSGKDTPVLAASAKARSPTRPDSKNKTSGNATRATRKGRK